MSDSNVEVAKQDLKSKKVLPEADGALPLYTAPVVSDALLPLPSVATTPGTTFHVAQGEKSSEKANIPNKRSANRLSESPLKLN